MTKLKVALLEDEEFLLKDLKSNLESTGLVEVVFYSLTAKGFIEKMEAYSRPEALLLDIDLRGESITGLDISVKYKLPTLFISGKTKDFNTELEDMDINFDFPVMRLRKPIANDALLNALKKFIKEIRSLQKIQTIKLNLLNLGTQVLPADSIVFMSSKGESSNNKEIFFTDQQPDVLANLTFKRIADFGFDPDTFLRVSKQVVVNKSHISRYISKEQILVVKAMNIKKELIEFKLAISEDYQPIFRKVFK